MTDLLTFYKLPGASKQTVDLKGFFFHNTTWLLPIGLTARKTGRVARLFQTGTQIPF